MSNVSKMGHQQNMKTQMICHKMWHHIRVCTVGYHKKSISEYDQEISQSYTAD